jgi:hypothetical protein
MFETKLAELAAIDPQVASAAQRLLSLVAAFRVSPIQAVAMLPVLQ